MIGIATVLGVSSMFRAGDSLARCLVSPVAGINDGPGGPGTVLHWLTSLTKKVSGLTWGLRFG